MLISHICKVVKIPVLTANYISKKLENIFPLRISINYWNLKVVKWFKIFPIEDKTEKRKPPFGGFFMQLSLKGQSRGNVCNACFHTSYIFYSTSICSWKDKAPLTSTYYSSLVLSSFYPSLNLDGPKILILN